jgi:L-asparaginase
MKKTTTKIYVLNTGGTLGMVGKPLRPANSATELLEGITVPKNTELFLADFPERQDSTNVTHAHRVQMGHDIVKNYASYDAFVILHGTDTLAETCAILTMMFKRSLQKPVFVIGAQMTKKEAGSEVAMQIENTLRMADAFVRKDIVGVFNLCIADVWDGARLRKRADSNYNAFYTPGRPAVANTFPHIMFQNGLRVKDKVLAVQGLRIDDQFERNIATFIVSADTPPWVLMDQVKNKRIKGAILECKGAGQISNVIWEDGETKYSWIDAIRAATEAGIHIGVISPFEDGRVSLTRYELGQAVADAGGISLESLTPAMGDAKFRQGVAQHPDDRDAIQDFISTDIVQELLPGYEDEHEE